MKQGNELSWSQVVMAANAPMMTKAALVDGRTDVGVLPTGQVVGVIDELPTVAELIGRIVTEADAVLDRLTPVGGSGTGAGWAVAPVSWPPASARGRRPERGVTWVRDCSQAAKANPIRHWSGYPPPRGVRRPDLHGHQQEGADHVVAAASVTPARRTAEMAPTTAAGSPGRRSPPP